MADRAFQELFHRSPLLTLGDQAKHNLQLAQVGLNDLRHVGKACVTAGAGQIAPLKHLLGNQSLVLQGPGALNDISLESGQTGVADAQAMAIGQLLQTAAQLQALSRNPLPAALVTITSSVFRAAVGQMRSVQNALLMKVLLAASIMARRGWSR